MNQDNLFLDYEGDRYFERNLSAMIGKKPDEDLITKTIKNMFGDWSPNSVIEWGASNGFRLNFLREIFKDCKRFVGIDASKSAVEDGKKRYNLELYGGGVADFPEFNEGFDLSIVNFVFHWIDRENLLASVCNVDRSLKDGGILIIGDFYPDFPQKKKYHHLPGKDAFTYKADYAKMFKSFCTYKEIYRLCYDYNGKHDSIKTFDSGDDGYISILRKNLHGYYKEL